MRLYWSVKYLMVVLLMAAACAQSIVGRLRANDYALIQEGHYSGSVLIRNGDVRIEKLVAPWRAALEDEPELLRGAGAKYFSIPPAVPFHYMYVAEDSAAHRLILRYFAYEPKPMVIAGWQLQFVFDERSGKLVGGYAQELPLE